MPDSNSKPHSSQPLFEQKDILHDIETVQAKWEIEHRRRRTLMIKVFIIGGIFLMLAIGSVIYKIHKINQIRISIEEKAAMKYMPIGYKEAKIHIIAYENETYEGVDDILREAVDNMPSEFYIELKSLQGVDGEEVEKALDRFRPGISINKQYKFTIKDADGNDKEVQFIEKPGQFFKLPDLAAVINKVHKEVYGDRYLQPVNTYSTNRLQAIPIEGMDDESSGDGQTARKNDDDDDKQEEPEDVTPRIKMSPDELKVPKFDAKQKK